MLNKTEYNRLWQRPDDMPLTGRGCVIGIIDQPLWREHQGYRDNIQDSQSINGARPNDTSWHGTAVTSIAVGEIGVARDAKVVYRAVESGLGREIKLKNNACALRDLKAFVEAGNHLDSISVSLGWWEHEQGGAENICLSQWFEDRNIPVFSCGTTPVFPSGPKGIAEFRLKTGRTKPELGDGVGIPCDARLIACENPRIIQENDGKLYVHTPEGGFSWAVPFVAGMFALAREAQPGITRKEFTQILNDTAQKVDFGEGVILPMADVASFAGALTPNPAALIKKRVHPHLKK